MVLFFSPVSFYSSSPTRFHFIRVSNVRKKRKLSDVMDVRLYVQGLEGDKFYFASKFCVVHKRDLNYMTNKRSLGEM
jgi:hypothetical protein